MTQETGPKVSFIYVPPSFYVSVKMFSSCQDRHKFRPNFNVTIMFKFQKMKPR